MCWNQSDANLETYELKISTFEHGQPEEFPVLINNLNTTVDRIGTTLATVKINYIHDVYYVGNNSKSLTN